MMVSVSLEGNGGPREDAFWRKLDSGWISIANTETPETTPEGWVLLGYGCSIAPRDPKSGGGIMSGFRFQLQGSTYVGALVLRSFKTEEEQRRAMKEASQSSSQPDKSGGP